MMSRDQEYICSVIELSARMLNVADRGESADLCDESRVISGIIRDSAYRVMESAERERSRLQLSGRWGKEG